jgi:hypothetical protein
MYRTTFFVESRIIERKDVERTIYYIVESLETELATFRQLIFFLVEKYMQRKICLCTKTRHAISCAVNFYNAGLVTHSRT